MKLIGMDVGSTTVKAVVVEDGRVTWQDYQRHNTRQAEKVFEFLERMEREGGVAAGRDRIFFTGSGAGFLAPLAGGKLVQEVVAVAACVEKLHPDVRFVSEIGGEDMKTIFFTATGTGPAGTDVAKSKQVFMQSACSGGTGTFVEKTARKLQVPSERLADMPYDGQSLHKVSSKCGIFAETDANTLVKTGVPVEEIIASLFEAVVYQNLATLTKGNTPMPEVLLLGGPNLFFAGLQQAWRHHLTKLWAERKIALPEGRDPASLILVPTEALYYACLGCVEVGRDEAETVGVYAGSDKLRWWIDEGQHEQKAKDGGKALVAGAADLVAFKSQWEAWRAPAAACGAGAEPSPAGRARPDRLRLRQHHRQGRRAVARARAALQLLRAVQGQSDRGRAVAVPPGAGRRLHRGAAGSPSPGTARTCSWTSSGRTGHRRDGGARHRGAALLPRRRRDLRRGRHRRQDHDPAPGDGGGLPAELAVLVRQRRVPARGGRALQHSPRAVCRARLRGQGHAGAGHGLRRLSRSPTS